MNMTKRIKADEIGFRSGDLLLALDHSSDAKITLSRHLYDDLDITNLVYRVFQRAQKDTVTLNQIKQLIEE